MADRLRSIPTEYVPLFEAKTAHQSMRAATSLVSATDPNKQRSILTDVIFQNVVLSAMTGLDECRDQHATELVNSFAPELRQSVLKLLYSH